MKRQDRLKHPFRRFKADGVIPKPTRGWILSDLWNQFRQNRSALVGLVLFVVLVAMCYGAPLLRPSQLVTSQNLKARFVAPGDTRYPLGTDNLGRDLLARLLYGGRTSITLGLLSAIASMLLGSAIGLAAGYFPRLDNLIMRVVDIFASIPAILMALAIVTAIGSSVGNIIIAISVSRVPTFARVIRATTLSLVDQEFVEAARAGGAGPFRIIRKQILPNCLGILIIQTTMSMASLILYAASLSFIGLGIQPPMPEWGSMLSEARQYMRQAAYLMLLPGLGIVMVTLSLNLVGDGLRDALDPRLKT